MSRDWRRWPSKDSPGFPVHAGEILHCVWEGSSTLQPQSWGFKPQLVHGPALSLFFFPCYLPPKTVLKHGQAFRKKIKMNLSCPLSQMHSQSKAELGSLQTYRGTAGEDLFLLFFFLNTF